jgi:aminocarboxymuconate-semialdehyde decarboxylase
VHQVSENPSLATTLIDVHTHFVPGAWPSRSAGAVGSGGAAGVAIAQDPEREGFLRITRGERTLRVVGPEGWAPSARLRGMDDAGVARHVVSPAPFTFLYDAPPDEAADICRFQNEALVEFRRADPDRLLGFGVVPLQDPTAAVEELRHVAAQGLQGVAIGTEVAGLHLGDPGFFEVYEAAAALGLAIFIHPQEDSVDPALERAGLGFGCGYPLATTAAAAQLAWSGVLDRFPDLRICLAHGGGALPSLVGRLGLGWERLAGRAGRLRMHPREALARFWTDSLTYDPEVLRLVLSLVGPGHVVLGTDFPFAAQETPAGRVVREAESRSIVSAEESSRILSRNALTLLGLDR